MKLASCFYTTMIAGGLQGAMIMNKRIHLVLLACLTLAQAARADLVFFDIDADPGAWNTAVAGLSATAAYDFTLDPDYLFDSFDGPLDTAGRGPVSAGTVAAGVSITAEPGSGTPELVVMGVSEGLGTTQNVVAANFFVDDTVVSFVDAVSAFAFNVVELIDFGSIDIVATDSQGGSSVFTDIFAGLGHNVGILATGATRLSTVALSGVGEGLQGVGTIYRESASVPAPPTLLLLGVALAGLCASALRRPCRRESA